MPRAKQGGAALSMKSQFWIGRVHPPSAEVSEWHNLNLKIQVEAEMPDK